MAIREAAFRGGIISCGGGNGDGDGDSDGNNEEEEDDDEDEDGDDEGDDEDDGDGGGGDSDGGGGGGGDSGGGIGGGVVAVPSHFHRVCVGEEDENITSVAADTTSLDHRIIQYKVSVILASLRGCLSGIGFAFS